jgi:lambda family phage portal protein
VSSVLERLGRRIFGSTISELESKAQAIEQQRAAFASEIRGTLVQDLTRAYRAASNTGQSSPWGLMSTSSADAEIRTGLTNLRGRSRQVVRDSGYAKRARSIIVDNIVGARIGFQGNIKGPGGKLKKKLNDSVEGTFEKWKRPEFCHDGGALHFDDLERLVMGEVFEAGEVFVRKHRRAFGGSAVPFALEVIESERCPHAVQPPAHHRQDRVRMGVELDSHFRALGYWFLPRHPSELEFDGFANDRIEFVPASDVIHLRLIDRWPQTRGVPMMHTAMRKLQEMDGYSEAEVMAARAGAMFLGWLEGSEWDDTLFQQAVNDQRLPEELRQQLTQARQVNLNMKPATILTPPPGMKLQFHNPTRPNAALDAFMRYMLREMAAGIGVSYEALSKDFSQTNYSSSRLSLIDDRERWRIFQSWFIRSFREPLHREWLNMAVLAGAVEGIDARAYGVDPEYFEAARWKPRGWGWIDPKSEEEAYENAVKAGFMTRTGVIALTGGGDDVEDVDDEREAELAAAKDKGLVYSTDPDYDNQPDSVDTAIDGRIKKAMAKKATEEPETEGERALRVVK